MEEVNEKVAEFNWFKWICLGYLFWMALLYKIIKSIINIYVKA